MYDSLYDKALVAQLLTELFERVSDEPLQHLITRDFQLRGTTATAGSEAPRGLDALRPLLDRLECIVHRPRLRVEDLLADGGRVAARFDLQAQRRSGGIVRSTGTVFATVHGGRVLELWLEESRGGLLHEIGAGAAAG